MLNCCLHIESLALFRSRREEVLEAIENIA